MRYNVSNIIQHKTDEIPVVVFFVINYHYYNVIKYIKY